MPRLGIVIPTVGRLDALRLALARLEGQCGEPSQFEVVVVHSTDTDPDAVQRTLGHRPYRVRRVLSPRGDASSQRNAGWRQLSTPLVLFVGEDILASPRLVVAHMQAHARWPEPNVGVLGRVQWPRRPRPTPFMRWLENGIQFDFRGLRDGDDAGWWRFYTANASVKRAMLERVGGFDEICFPFLYEDLDLAARMAEHGFQLRYAAGAAAEHLHPQTLADWRRRVRLIAAAERRFCERHPASTAYFHALFSEALARPRARGRAARLAGVIPPTAPWLGRRVWGSFDLWQRQQLAPDFLAAWDAAAKNGAAKNGAAGA